MGLCSLVGQSSRNSSITFGVNRAAANIAERNAMRPHRFPINSTVVVEGLRQATAYNGLPGTVLDHAPCEPGHPVKYQVRLRVDGQDKVLAVREDNLRKPN